MSLQLVNLSPAPALEQGNINPPAPQPVAQRKTVVASPKRAYAPRARNLNRPGLVITEEIAERIRILRDEGKSVERIGQELNIKPITVGSHLKREKEREEFFKNNPQVNGVYTVDQG